MNGSAGGAKVAGEALWAGITSPLSTIGGLFNQYVLQPIKAGLDWFGGGAKVAGEALWAGITTPLSTIGGLFNQYVLEPIKAGLEWFAGGAKLAGDAAWKGLTELWANASQWFTDNFIDPLSSIWETFKKGAQEAGTAAYNNLTGAFAGFAKWWNESVASPMGKWWEGAFGGGKTAAEAALPTPSRCSANQKAADEAKTGYNLARENLAVQNQNLATGQTSTRPPPRDYGPLLGLTTQGNPFSPVALNEYNKAMARTNQLGGEYIMIAGKESDWGTKLRAIWDNWTNSLTKGNDQTANATEGTKQLSAEEQKAADAAAKAAEHEKAMSGELGQVARNAAYAEEGVKAQNEALSVMVATVSKTAAENAVLNKQIEDQSILIASANLGYQNAVKAFQNMQVATAAVSGEVKFLSENLTATEGVLARTSIRIPSRTESRP